ncbi:hypothetical protein LTR87_018018, partial [Friedmanniomyces endolithicus]
MRRNFALDTDSRHAMWRDTQVNHSMVRFQCLSSSKEMSRLPSQSRLYPRYEAAVSQVHILARLPSMAFTRMEPTALILTTSIRKSANSLSATMVPQMIRRRYSTMFNEYPPFAYEGTHDSRYPTVPSCRSESPSPTSQYWEDTLLGYAPHASPPSVVALNHDQAIMEKMSLRDVVPALYSSPRLSPAKAAELVRQDQEAFDQMEFP